MIVQNQCFSFRILLKTNKFWTTGMTVQNQCFSLGILLNTNHFWAVVVSVQIHENSIENKNSDPKVWVFRINAFLSSFIENESSLSRRYVCQEAILCFKHSVNNDSIHSWRYHCSESMFLFLPFLWKRIKSKPEVQLCRINAVLWAFYWTRTTFEPEVELFKLWQCKNLALAKEMYWFLRERRS